MQGTLARWIVSLALIFAMGTGTLAQFHHHDSHGNACLCLDAEAHHCHHHSDSPHHATCGEGVCHDGCGDGCTHGADPDDCRRELLVITADDIHRDDTPVTQPFPGPMSDTNLLPPPPAATTLRHPRAAGPGCLPTGFCHIPELRGPPQVLYY